MTATEARKKRDNNKCIKIALAISLSLWILTILYPAISRVISRKLMRFDVGTESFENWISNRAPFNFTVYFYNWTNPEEIYNTSSKPRFEEVGPYNFHLYMKRFNVTVHDNGTTTATVSKFFYYDAANSRPLDDVVTSLNPVPNSMAFRGRYRNRFSKLGISIVLRSINAELHLQKTVGEFLFGFEDPVLSTASRLPGLDVPKKFGYLYGKNGTDMLIGPLNFHSIVDDNFGKLYYYKGRNTSQFFDDPCNKVGGTIGDFLEMEHDPNEKITIFSTDLESTLDLHYEKTLDYKTVSATKYSIKDHAFDNGTYNPANKCFCSGDCIPGGVFNMSRALKGSPIFFSQPHFYQGDPLYRENVEINEPNPEEDAVYLYYEKALGILLRAELNIQVNMLLQSIPGIGLYSNVPKIMFPIFRLKQGMECAPYLYEKLFYIQKIPLINYYISIITLCVSISLALYLFMNCLRSKKRSRKF